MAMPARSDTVLENFESYPDGQVVGASAISSPWRRFGAATNDHVTATRQERWLITGQASGLYGLVWPNPFGAVRYVLDKPTDLSTYRSVTVKMKSDKDYTHTQVKLAISNGHTTYVTIASKPLNTQIQEMRFELGQTLMIRTAGEDDYDQVVQGVWNIGFDFRNSEGDYVETIIFDDFELID